MTTHPQSRWISAAIILQSLILFLVTFLLCATPHLWDDIYMLLEGKQFPAITRWIRAVAPGSGTGMICLAAMVSLTHLCIGLLLLDTATTEMIAAQRALFLTTTTWGIVILVAIIALMAQALPFAHIIPSLPSNEERTAAAAQSRAWFIWATVYGTALIAMTIVVSRRSRKAEPSGSRNDFALRDR